ncbi:hypothetical protein KO481_22800 [Nocardia sp. NEAU-G5]|uniref:Uncharacterized protein n=1 Tax=Nocardia albiluteola TaxID=2842303 RepID=A0ABS6B3K4_9NOCA|nr:hypothetical protein [Nocardia albiluteola]MBU3064350.1 hypothetical protein [Nocardia albiluteola]
MTELSERWARTRYTDLRYYGTPTRGGHFAAYETPRCMSSSSWPVCKPRP